MRVCWVCGPWTHERLHVCVYVEEIISVFSDPCQAQRSDEFLWYFLRMIPRPHIFSTHLSAAMKEWTVQSKEQVQKDSSNPFSIYTLYWREEKRNTCNPLFKVRFKAKKGIKLVRNVFKLHVYSGKRSYLMIWNDELGKSLLKSSCKSKFLLVTPYLLKK